MFDSVSDLHMTGKCIVRTLDAISLTRLPSSVASVQIWKTHTEARLSLAVLRTVLTEYLGVDAAALEIGTGRHGKPYLSSPCFPIEFNLSHSGEWMLLAISQSHEVGIDLEIERTDFDYAGLSRSFFSEKECASLQRASPVNRHRDFLRIWTRKEALAKAIGSGLSMPFRNVDVLAGEQLNGGWLLCDLDAGMGYIAALASRPKKMPR